MQANQIIDISYALMLVLLAFLICAAFINKGRRFKLRSSSSIELEGVLALGPKEKIMTIKVGGLRLLVGVTSHSMQTLATLDPKARPVEHYSQYGAANEESHQR